MPGRGTGLWADLDRFMFKLDAPYVRRQVGPEAWEATAKGRSALALVEWCSELVKAGSVP